MNSSRNSLLSLSLLLPLTLAAEAETAVINPAITVAVVRFAPAKPFDDKQIVELNNTCVDALKVRHADVASRACTAALMRAKSYSSGGPFQLYGVGLFALEPEAFAATYSNAALMRWQAGDRAMAEKYLQRAAAIAPQASFVVRNRAAFSQLAAKSLVTAIK